MNKVKTLVSIAAVSIAVALVLLLAVAVPLALADEDTSQGQFTASNAAPEVITMTLASSMTPYNAGGYDLVVTVQDANTLDDITAITVTLFYDSDSDNSPSTVPTAGDNQDAAILTWVKSGDTWNIAAGSESPQTWSIASVSCISPTMTSSSGDWTFHFTPGKVAQEHATEWDIYATAMDDASASHSLYDSRNYAMEWYGAISIDLATINFGTVAKGVDDDASQNFVLTNIANGDYQLELKAAATWTGGSTSWNLSLDTGDDNPGDAELALEADDDATVGDAQLVTDAYLDYTDHSGDTGPTDEDGADISTNTLWLSLGDTGIVADTYTGSIYYQILNN